MPIEKKVQMFLGIVAFSALFWGLQAQSDLLQNRAFGCIRLIVVLGVYYYLSVEHKECIQEYAISLSGSFLILFLLYGYATGERFIALIGIAMYISLLGALGHSGSIWTGTYWGASQIYDNLLIYSISIAITVWIRFMYRDSFGKPIYLFIPFVFGTLVAVVSLLKGTPLKLLCNNIAILISFLMSILVCLWVCLQFILQYIIL